jgi:hypothetical protein
MSERAEPKAREARSTPERAGERSEQGPKGASASD